MKYVITSCNRKKGIKGDDTGNLTQYFELGWELIISRLCLISMIKEGFFDPEKDTVVTNSSREFLYSKFCKNVMAFEDYEKINFSQDDKVFDLVEQVVLAGGYGVNNSVPKLWGVSAINAEEPYKYTIKEAPEIQQFDLLDIKNVVKDDSNYICFVVRQRDWCDHRNLSQDQINKCLEYAKQKNLTVYVMGKGCEKYTNSENRVYHVSLQEMATLINDTKCRALLTTLTGGSVIRFFTGTCRMITFDLGSEYNPKTPLWGGDMIVFSNLKPYNWILLNKFEENILHAI
jgi:hypothetical protein